MIAEPTEVTEKEEDRAPQAIVALDLPGAKEK